MAIVVPDEEILVRWAEETERGSVPFEDLCKDEVQAKSSCNINDDDIMFLIRK